MGKRHSDRHSGKRGGWLRAAAMTTVLLVFQLGQSRIFFAIPLQATSADFSVAMVALT